MILYLIITAIIIFACVIMNKLSNRFGVPTLLAFIGLGMLFGVEGPFRFAFDNFEMTENICTVALIFIMFYGGFGTNWKVAKKVVTASVLLSTAGVVMTATVCAVFCHFVLRFSWVESFLMGSVISSTDAASVFSILKSRKLSLKYNTASVLELESGSNDPVAYMMTAVFISVAQGNASGGQIVYMIFAQLVYGAAIGAGISLFALWVFKKTKGMGDGLNMIFVIGIALAAYAVPAIAGGNGYLSTYIVGIVLGNSRIKDKAELVHFFDGITLAAQILVFFLLGFLSTPSNFPAVIVPGIIIAIFLTFAARPAVVFALLTPFKAKLNQKLLVSWSGLRGASSIVFAISVFLGAKTENNIFYITFFIVLFSIFLQGTLLPKVSEKLNMIDENENVMKTFTDYTDEVPIQYIKFNIPEGHEWSGRQIRDVSIPPETIFVLLKRKGENIVPTGKTVIESGDCLVLSAKKPVDIEGIELREIIVRQGDDEYLGKSLAEISTSNSWLVIMIQRDSDVIIPKGDVILQEGDILVINEVDA